MAATHTSIHNDASINKISWHIWCERWKIVQKRKSERKNARMHATNEIYGTVLMKFMHRLHHDHMLKKRLRDLMIEISMAKSNFILQKEQKQNKTTWQSCNAHAYTEGEKV